MKKNFRVMDGHEFILTTAYETAAEALAEADERNSLMKPEYQTYVVIRIEQVSAATISPEKLEARAEARKLGDALLPCEFCHHPLGGHNRIEGCITCDCLASPGEARRKRSERIRIEDTVGHFVTFASSHDEAVRIIEHQRVRWHRTVHPVNVCGDFPAPCNCDDPTTHNGH